jgi:hypothetical protein
VQGHALFRLGLYFCFILVFFFGDLELEALERGRFSLGAGLACGLPRFSGLARLFGEWLPLPVALVSSDAELFLAVEMVADSSINV